MRNQDEELDKFKREVNLTEYAATLGYAIDRRASGRNSAVMTHPALPKIVVAKGEDHHWIYFSVGDPADHGSIIDFVRRRGVADTLGEVRVALRPWLNGSVQPFLRPPAEAFAADLLPSRKDAQAVRVRYEAMRPIENGHVYLENARQIPWHILTDSLFADRVRSDQYGNAIFPHFNLRDGGLCGYEIKGPGVTRFATGGTRGLWCSRTGTADIRLVIAESAIDALSFAALKYAPGTRYVSTAGELGVDQPLLLQRAMERMPDGSQVILALDNDAGGNQIGSKIEAVFGMVNRPGLALAYDRPKVVKDWNDALRAPSAPGHQAPTLRPRPKF